MRHERLDFLRHAHALFDRALHADQADAVLVLHQLADRANAAVAEVIDVVDRALAVLQIDEVANRLEDVALGQHAILERLVDLELVVQLQAADLREVVALGVEEQVVEQCERGLGRGWVTRAQAPVDLHDRLVGRRQLVGDQRVAQVAADVEPVDEQHLERGDAVIAQLVELGLGHFLVALQEHFAGVLVDHVVRGDLADDFGHFGRQLLDLGVLQLLDGGLGELAVLLDQDLARLRVPDVAGGALARKQVVLDRLLVLLGRLEEHRLRRVEIVEQLFGRVPERAQENRRVQLAATVDAHVQDVLRVELEVEPRAAVRDHAGGVQ